MKDYPNSPGFKAPGPSEEAAEKVAGQAQVLRSKVLALYQRIAPQGLTADEVAKWLDISILSIRPRVSELHRSGLLEDTGGRRRNESGMRATVWRYVADRQTETVDPNKPVPVQVAA